MSHEAKSYLHQKILTVDKFPGTYLIGNISIIINATAVKYTFLNLHRKANCLIYVVKDKFEL